MKRRLLVLALCTLPWSLGGSSANASTEEFQSFDVARQEEDDENLLDHHLTRPPMQWKDEWDLSHGGFRSSQGCLTSGQWFMVTDLKVRAPLGEKAWLDIAYRDVQDNEGKYGWLQLDFRYPTRIGAWGWRFRPNYDKGSQDFALLYDHGDATTPLQIQAAFTFEDMFNSLWAFRQSRVGDRSEPYRKHPFEPALRVVHRGAAHRLEVHGQWLTSSIKDLEELDPAENRRLTLWGERAGIEAQMTRGAWSAEARFDQIQAQSTDTPVSQLSDSRSFRRRWTSELALRRTISDRLSAEARWVYQERTQDWRPLLGDAGFHAIDRMPMAEVAWRAREGVLARFGTMYDRIGIASQGQLPGATWGSRKESRLFVGLQVRFGKVLVQGTECIELDHEAYDVSLHHDKGFLHIQTTF